MKETTSFNKGFLTIVAITLAIPFLSIPTPASGLQFERIASGGIDGLYNQIPEALQLPVTLLFGAVNSR